MALDIFICLIIGYAFGNFSTGYFIGKSKHVDIRKYGSGNSGATNALRTLGKKAAAMTFAGDFLKAVIPILLIRLCLYSGLEYTEILVLIAGFGVVTGHNFPCWLHFKGGKGIAATAGVFVAFDYRIIPIGLPIFILAVLITKYVSVGSLLIAVMMPIWIAITQTENLYYIPMIFIGCCYTISAFYKHRANLIRLLHGTENKIGQHIEIEKE